MQDLGIVNGRAYLDGRLQPLNLYIKDGRITDLTTAFHGAKEEYDARGRMVPPGFIDPHVHFSMQGARWRTADTFATGTAAALFGGVTTIVDFLDCAPDCTGMQAAFARRRAQAAGALCDFSFHASVSNPAENAQALLQTAKKLGLATVKVYTTYKENGSYTSLGGIDRLLACSADEKVRILVHAENDEMLRKTDVPVAEHGMARPVIAETAEVIQLAELARYRQGLLYIVHISAGTTLQALRESFGGELSTRILTESCPHYFLFDDSAYAGQDACLYTMAPPLRPAAEQRRLRSLFDSVNVIGTDHCTYSSAQKRQALTQDIPMGVGGIECSFRAMYGLFGLQAVEKFTANPSKAHGLYPRKGTLLPGADADLVIFDETAAAPMDGRHSACDYSLYEVLAAPGRIDCTLLRGRFAVRDNRLCRSAGEFIPAALS